MIRRMTQRDIPAVQHVARESWHATYAGIIPKHVQDDFLHNAYSDEQMVRRLQHSHLWVAEKDGEVVGYANFSPVTDGKVELGAIYLLPAYQGQGIGTALLNRGLQELLDVKEVWVNVEKQNRIGRTFYEAKGFQLIKEFTEDFAGHQLQTVRMVLKVNGKKS
jgi:GNAT superfamily N-acetyltransferase